MKKIFATIVLFQLSFCLFAQVPQKMSYQAVVRNDKDSLLANQSVNVRISILQGNALGEAVYIETQSVMTNKNGLMTLEIGEGSIIDGNFHQIDWGNGPYYIKSEIDPRGSYNYTITSTQQLLSVPYALYSENAGNVTNNNCPTVNICDLNNSISSMQNMLISLFNTVSAQNARIDSLQDLLSGAGPITMLPVVTTSSVYNISENTANCGGNVTYDGGEPVAVRGVCWSTLPNPTLTDQHTIDGAGLGTFSSSITGLTPNTTYYVRAYATNSNGTSYGDQKFFTTILVNHSCPGDSTVTDYDGNVYGTVLIGGQCWMKENLRTTHYSDGTTIALGGLGNNSYDVAYRFYPGGNSSNVSMYGYLYNWKAMMRNASSSSTNPSGIQGICPNGWHLPSDAEWTQLITYVGNQSAYQCGSNSSYIAKSLASTTNWTSSLSTCAVGNIPTDNNATGFTAVSAGDCDTRASGGYASIGLIASFWSATQLDIETNYAYTHHVSSGNAHVSSTYYYKWLACSVRCLRD